MDHWYSLTIVSRFSFLVLLPNNIYCPLRAIYNNDIKENRCDPREIEKIMKTLWLLYSITTTILTNISNPNNRTRGGVNGIYISSLTSLRCTRKQILYPISFLYTWLLADIIMFRYHFFFCIYMSFFVDRCFLEMIFFSM